LNQTDSVSVLYVAVDGDDGNDGSIDKPFKTLEGARDAIRVLRSAGKLGDNGVVVNLRGGVYEILEPFELDERDSGTEVGRIIYRSMEGEDVYISGGPRFLLSEFAEITDSDVLGRLHPDAKGKAVMLDLRKRGITEHGQLPLYGHSMSCIQTVTRYKMGGNAPELFFNGNPLTLSRWPNDGFTKVEKVIDKGDVVRDWLDDRKGQKVYVPLEERADPPRGFTIEMDKQRLVRWKDAKDIWLYGYWYNNWSDQSLQVAQIDPQQGTIKSLQPSCYGVKSKQRFYVYNLIEEMDQRGEWYLDRELGILYLIPSENDTKGELYLSLSTEPFIKMDGVSNVRVDGIGFGYTRGTGIVITASSNIEIVNCRVGNTGGQGIRISDGSRNSVRNCEIFNNGSGGIVVSGGDILNLIPASNVVENNLIYNYARIEKTYKPAIGLLGVGNRVAHNEIHSGAHMAIGFSGNNHIIEYNHIYDVARETDDMAAIYSGRSWTSRGTVIRYNLLRNITGYKAGTHRVSGIYLDDGISGITVEGNIFINLAQGLLFNGGRDNTAVNNVFIDVENMMRSTSLKEAYTTWAASSWKTLNEKFKQMPLNKEPWLSAYPHLANMLEDEPELPKYTTIKDNLYYNTHMIIGKKGIHEVVTESGTVENNIQIDKKPGSYDPENEHFNFNPTYGVFDVMSGLKNIPTKKIGRISFKD
ncbi:MAG: right-handed parallel beta-helix repeat-containing protein, partial [Methanosarcinaceae archaeon]|nr:right-handed parallel beta-helix repeat-containing protein [Methanosarcinaceae archaeon]